MAYEKKTIIHNVAQVPDEVALEMVLRLVKEGRLDCHCTYGFKKFSGGYVVTSRKPSKQSETDVFFITKVDKDAR